MILRIAVHFAGFRRHLADHFPNKQREFGCSGVTSSPNTQQLSESASMVKGIDLATGLGASVAAGGG